MILSSVLDDTIGIPFIPKFEADRIIHPHDSNVVPLFKGDTNGVSNVTPVFRKIEIPSFTLEELFPTSASEEFPDDTEEVIPQNEADSGNLGDEDFEVISKVELMEEISGSSNIEPDSNSDPEVLVSEEQPELLEETETEVSKGKEVVSSINVEEIRQEGYQTGYAVGLQDGAQKTAKEMEAKTLPEKEAYAKLIASLSSAGDDHAGFFEPVTRLSMHLAEQIVRGELSFSKTVIERLVNGCLDDLKNHPIKALPVLSLHPDDRINFLEDFEEPPGGLEVRADESLARGSVALRMNGSAIEDLVQHRLEALALKILGGRAEWSDDSFRKTSSFDSLKQVYISDEKLSDSESGAEKQVIESTENQSSSVNENCAKEVNTLASEEDQAGDFSH